MLKAPTYFVEQVGGLAIPKRLSDDYLKENAQQLPSTIYSEIRALTADKRTHNHTFYPEASLRGVEQEGTGLISFTRPYPIPVIKDHNATPGPFGGSASEVYGRIFHPAQFIRVNNEGFVRVMATISHPEAIEGVLTGRWLTVSLGSRTESVKCSVCETELTRGMCDHERGEEYEGDGAGHDPNDGKTPVRAMWMIGPIRSKELSFVVSPSDDQAGVVTPHNTQFPTESEYSQQHSFLSRILVGNSKGVFDLVTGKRIEESAFFTPPQTTRKNFHFIGASVKENQVNPAGFHGAGDYLLGKGDHEHLVALDDRGYGNSGPAYKPGSYTKNEPEPTEPTHLPTEGEDPSGQPDPQLIVDRHVHDVVAGAVRPGEDNHVHDLIPKDVPDRRDPHEGAKNTRESDDAPLTFAALFMLPDNDPDSLKTEILNNEAVLTAKTRNALPTSAFCGPNRSFPAHDKAHVKAGLSYLDRSNLTPEQKSRTRSCLVRRGKLMGMDTSGSQKKETMYAARLEDAGHRVEIDLYPLPSTCEELDAVLGQVRSMSHTEEEQKQILGRLAAHSKEFLATADWQTRFGNLTVCEAGPAVKIAVTPENYGLVYAAIQNCPSAKVTKEEVKEGEENKDCGCTESETTTEVNETEEKTELSETSVSSNTDVVELQTRIKEQNKDLVEAFASSVALYQIALKKAQSRGKSLDEMLEKLSTRTVESLKDTLSDLREEWTLQDSSIPVTIPRVADPTKPKETAAEEGVVTETSADDTSTETETKETETAHPILQLSVLEELDLEENDEDRKLVYRLYPELTDEEKSS